MDGYLRSLPAPSGNGALAGEFTANNFVCTCAPAFFAARFHPHAKLIVLLRDPIQRAASRYAEQTAHPVAYGAKE